jgi:hypothetical protein
MAYALELEAEQQDEGTGSADPGGQGFVCEAALEELPPLVVVEEVRRFLAREDGDVQAAGEAAGGGPVQERSPAGSSPLSWSSGVCPSPLHGTAELAFTGAVGRRWDQGPDVADAMSLHGRPRPGSH